MEFQNKKVLVCGMARSGIAAAILLAKVGAQVTLQDLKTREMLEEQIAEVEKTGLPIALSTGKNPDEILSQMDLIVVSPGIAYDLPFLMEAKRQGIPVIGEVELAYLHTPCPIIAITGTNGKTTTTALVEKMLKRKYPGTAAVGNIGVPFCSKVIELTKEDYVVAEISSFQLETIEAFHPKISAVLNITPDHLNRHKTFETYLAMKERIFSNQTEKDFCILNFDDPYCKKMAQKTKARVIYFSSHSILEKGIYLQNGHIYSKWEGVCKEIIAVEKLHILGVHNYENAMAAIAAAIAAEVPIADIKQALLEFQAVEHRIEYVTTIEDVMYYNDSKGTNPDAAIRAVLAMNRPILLIGGGYDKGSDFTEWIATFPGRVKHLVLIGETTEKIAAEAERQGFLAITKIKSLEAAIDTCREKAQKGDCVLLSPACASWDMFPNYEERGRKFKEKVKSIACNRP